MSCRKITNQPNNYNWGSEVLIPKFMGVKPDGNPQAEVWLGSHPLSPSTYVDSEVSIDNDVSLPFLVKILAAAKPLSIQVHPNKIQAEEGFVKENISSIHINAYNRNYKDDNHKPEMLIAIEDGFKALCGFRDVSESVKVISEIMQHVEYSTDTNLLSEFIDFIKEQGNENLKLVVKELLSSSKGVEIAVALTQGLSKMNNRDSTYDDIRMLIEISSFFPNDVGVTIATLMNPVILRKGEALFLPAGNMHAYLSGIGVEIMANSDNVLRGGLTTKYIDTDELVEILDASILEEPVYKPEVLRGVNMYKPVSDFTVYDAKVKLETVGLHMQDCIAVALEDSSLKFGKEEVKLLKGESVLIVGEESATVKGHVVFAF